MRSRRGRTQFNLPFQVAGIMDAPKEQWGEFVYSNLGRKRYANHLASIDWDEYTPERYLLTHCSIVSSVNVESNGYYITPQSAKYVNANGNAWTTPTLKIVHRSFIGAENYYEHVQIQEMSKGKILDSVLREVVDEDGEKILYDDILVATDRKHVDLVPRIEAGELSTLSMGCVMSGTMVMMKGGTQKPIENVKAGEEVISHTGNVRKVITPIKTNWLGDVYDIYIDGRPNPIRCTGNHRFWKWTGKEECACGCGEKLPRISSESKYSGTKRRNLKSIFIPGHKLNIVNPMVNYELEELESRTALLDKAKEPLFSWCETRELDKGDYLTIPSNYEIGDEDVSVSRARLLGLYAAEGNLVGDKQIEFNYSINEKDTLGIETQKLLKEEFGIESSMYCREDHGLCVVRSYSNEFVRKWFESHCSGYSYSKCLSDCVVSWSLPSIGAFIGGWLDGDGCLDIKGRGRLVGVTTSYDLASQVTIILTRMGIYHTWNKRKPKWVIKRGKRSYNRLAHIITIPASQTGKIVSFTSRWNEDNLFPIHSKCHDQPSKENVVVRIKKIEKVRDIEGDNERLDVFCLEVEEEHSFLVNGGIATENCIANVTQCSRCGKLFTDDIAACVHIRTELRNFFIDEDGVERVVAEFCGYNETFKGISPEESCVFIEASWVEKPAFAGAVVNHFITKPEKHAKVYQKSDQMAELFDAYNIRVADRSGRIAMRLADRFRTE